MTHLKANLNEIADLAKKTVKTVGEMKNKKGKNIYKNITGFDKETNYELYDMSSEETGLGHLVFSMNLIKSGCVNGENKMTTGHSHEGQDEIYMIIEGKGQFVLRSPKGEEKFFEAGPMDVFFIPAGYWHRVVNTGESDLLLVNIFNGKTLPDSRK